MTDTPDDCIDVNEIYTGLLSCSARTTLLKIVSGQLERGLFPVSDKTLSQLHGREVGTPLIDEKVTLVACTQQRHNPPAVDIVNFTVDGWMDLGIVDYADCQWRSRTSIRWKKSGKPRLTINYRPLNAVTKKNSAGIGSLAGMHDRVKKSKWFTLVDLVQAYHQPSHQAQRLPQGRLSRTHVGGCSSSIGEALVSRSSRPLGRHPAAG